MLVNLLIQELKTRFSYELNSEIYLAASVLRTSHWYDLSYNLDYFQKGINSLENSYFLMCYKESSASETLPTESSINNESFKTPCSSKSDESDNFSNIILKRMLMIPILISTRKVISS